MRFYKKETLAQVFSCEFGEISKNTFFIDHLWTTGSDNLTISFLTMAEIIYRVALT